jgi:NAD(P)-dependent dehydrogenase (short-subunit alcohol dehydrogenase family)
VSEAEVREAVLAIVSEKTGYERELLGLDLDLEADLGVDTIKQAQILGAIRERYRLPREEGVKIKDFPTLAKVIGYIAGRLAASSSPSSTARSKRTEERTVFRGDSEADLENDRRVWRSISGCGRWVGEDLAVGLVSKYLREVRCEDPSVLELLREGPAVFIANHQTFVESLVFTSVVTTLTGGRAVRNVAKQEHRDGWIGKFLDLMTSHPEVRVPNPLLYVDRLDQDDVLRTSEAARKALASGLSVYVAAEGRREERARARIERLSAVWVELAIELGCPVVPVRFLGGLPLEGNDKRDVPVGHGKQTLVLGRALLSEALRPLDARSRIQAVLDALNRTGSPETEVPSAPDEALSAAVSAYQAAFGASEMAAVLFEALARARGPVQIEMRPGVHVVADLVDAFVAVGRLALAGVGRVALVLPDTPEGRWFRPLASWLFWERGPSILTTKDATSGYAAVVRVDAVKPPARHATEKKIRRFAVEVAPAPVEPGTTRAEIASRTWLVTDDGAGVAQGLRERLIAKGARVLIVGDSEAGAGESRVDLRSAENVRRFVAEARAAHGPIGGLIHLADVRTEHAPETLGPAEWARVLARDVKGFFHLVHELAGDLSAAPGGGVVAGVTWLGGGFGLDGRGVGRPSDGGIAGFAKALAREWPKALVKAIDLEPPKGMAQSDAAAARIFEELEAGGRRVEVGWRDDQRLAPLAVERPLAPHGAERGLRGEGAVVLLGGGRGITAEIARDLARRYRPSLAIVGTTSLPADIERIASRDASGLRELRQEIAREVQATMGRAAPLEVQARLDRLLRAADIHRTLRDLAAAGARASYHVCDVRDPAATARTLDEIRAEYGGIQGVVFGPGVIEDKPVERKTPESFGRVFDVKACGFFHVLRAVEDLELEFLVAFSSVSGRFGNAGQTDYAAANDLLAKLILHAAARRPKTRCFAIDWSAWSGIGLAARSGAADVLREAGLDLIDPAPGAALFHDELLAGGDCPKSSSPAISVPWTPSRRRLAPRPSSMRSSTRGRRSRSSLRGRSTRRATFGSRTT